MAKQSGPVKTNTLPAHILLADDDLLAQELTAEMLETIGCKVSVFDNGRQLLERLDQLTYDAILLDCEMPEIDGFQTTMEIRRREDESKKRVPIIAITANAFIGYKEKCLSAGMDDYISKPFQHEQLKAVLQRWLQEEYS